MEDLRALQRLLEKAMREIPKDVPKIIEVEGLAFINKNFRDQGFNTASGVKKWASRKTMDAKGRDITKYRTERRGRVGALNKYGRNIQGRAILVGHKTGGDKLKNSFRARRGLTSVQFITYKPYAERHNEGLKGMPTRKFMDESSYLDKKIESKLTRTLDRRFNR